MIYGELFDNEADPYDGDTLSVCRCICALADEVRAMRKYQEDRDALIDQQNEAEKEEYEAKKEQAAKELQELVSTVGQTLSGIMPTGMMPSLTVTSSLVCHGCGHNIMDHNQAGECQYGICECVRKAT